MKATTYESPFRTNEGARWMQRAAYADSAWDRAVR